MTVSFFITILDILDTMIGPDVDASIAANSVRRNIIACKGTTRSAQDTCVRSCADQEFELYIGEQGGSKCYHLSTNTLLYDSARESCRGFGGGSKLATINTGAENEFVRQLLHGSSNTDSVLIGLNDVADEGTFRWQGGKEVEWTNWGDAQPTGIGDEDCVILMHDGTWHDRECSISGRRYVCSMGSQEVCGSGKVLKEFLHEGTCRESEVSE